MRKLLLAAMLCGASIAIAHADDVACLRREGVFLCFGVPSKTHADGKCQAAQMTMLNAQNFASAEEAKSHPNNNIVLAHLKAGSDAIQRDCAGQIP